MKHVILILLLVLSAQVRAQLTYFGPSGYSFVPNGFTGSTPYGGSLSGALQSRDQLDLFPHKMSLIGSFMDERLEVSLSNTWSFVSSNGFEERRISDVPVTMFVPGLKWRLDLQKREWQEWGYVAGIMAPYGVYTAASWWAKLPLLQPEFTLGVSIWSKKAYALGGARLTLADLSANPLPLAFIADGAWAGSTKMLGETEEGFFSLGMSLDLSRNISLQGVFRKDPSIYYSISESEVDRVRKDNQNTNGTWGMRMTYYFDGVKSVGEGEK
jgi:hypothetical protein